MIRDWGVTAMTTDDGPSEGLAKWAGLLAGHPAPRNTIHLFDDRGEEVFRSPLRGEVSVNDRCRLVSVETVPIALDAPRFEIRDEGGNALWTGTMSRVIPAGDVVKVHVRRPRRRTTEERP
jgi:hypothetical protein